MTYTTEISRRIYDNDEGHCISISESGDFPKNVMIFTEGESKEYFGDIRIDLPIECMRQIAKAINDCADEIENKK